MNKITVNESFILQKTGKKVMLFSAEKSELYTLNETATLVFECLKKGMAKEEIISKLLTIYDVEEKYVTEDINNILTFFLSKEIIYLEKE